MAMEVQALRDQITDLEKRLSDLQKRLRDAEQSVISDGDARVAQPNLAPVPLPDNESTTAPRPLELEEYKRYGRQMIVPSIGIEGQLRLKKTKILIVGVGGLGCPAATYLAGAGVGTLGLVDGDTVELSNLHRQTLHSTETIGWNKTESAIRGLKRLNPNIRYLQYAYHLSSENAIGILEQYDLILDCTDHPTSRYLISDACVLTRKPLVSASALKTDGQLMTLNKPPGAGPCYRCIFPKPPPAESVTSCGEGGILGPVVGVMGVLQAAKAIEIVTQNASLNLEGEMVWHSMQAKLLIYSAFDPIPFRPPINLPRPRKNCASCSPSRTITKESLQSGSLDYKTFCGLTMPADLLEKHERITAEAYKKEMESPHILVDVREKLHFDICHIPNSLNVPYSKIQTISRNTTGDNAESNGTGAQLEEFENVTQSTPDVPILFVCRYGNDSQDAVIFLKTSYPDLAKDATGGLRFIGDIKGGLHAWAKVEPSFPDY